MTPTDLDYLLSRAQVKAEIEAVLDEGESVVDFVATAIQASVAQRVAMRQFLERGRASADGHGATYSAQEVMDGLRLMVEERRRQFSGN